MRVLILCSGTKGILSPFIKEQMDSIAKLGSVELSLFQVKKRGISGYLSHYRPMLKTIAKFKPDIIHAHYGLSGLLANLQRKVPVITTFHGSDVNLPHVLKWSRWAYWLSAESVFVEKGMMQKFRKHKDCSVIPCGVDTLTFHYVPVEEARKKLNLNEKGIYILFSSVIDNPVKNYSIAMESCNFVEKRLGQKVSLIELKGFSRELVNLYMNASDCFLLDSVSEGSPQVIKEAMACNCPIVATNVGDIDWIIGETKGCYITSHKVEDITDNLIRAIHFAETVGRTKGRDRILALELDTFSIARRIIEIYKKSISKQIS